MKRHPLLLGTSLFMALALLAMFSLHPTLGLALLVCWACAGGALLILLFRWPLFPLRPRHSEARKAGPLKITLCMGLMLILVLRMFYEPVWVVFSGRIFTSPFDRVWAGFALDQPTIGKWFFWFAFSAAVILPFVAAARELADRRARSGYWAFALPAAALCLCQFGILTLGFVMLLKYIAAMGFTPRRSYGLIFGLGSDIAILIFFIWAIRAPKNTPHKPDGSSKA